MTVSVNDKTRALSNWLMFLAAMIIALNANQPASSQSGTDIELHNLRGDMGGHTPRGFRGQGSGVFLGDNLNARFPNGDGVQAFISFDLSQVPDAINSAVLVSGFLRVNGTPFADLGDIRLERVEFEQFSSAIWDTPAQGSFGCTLTISTERDRATCDLTRAVQNALAKDSKLLQFRLRFDRASDSDGRQDLAMFFRRDVNQNEGGVFTLSIR